MSEKTREVTAPHGDNQQTQSRQDLHDGNGHQAAALTDADPIKNASGGLEDSDVVVVVEEPVAAKKQKRKKILYIGGAALLFFLIPGGAYWVYSRQDESTDDAFVEADVTQVSPKVSAYVKKIYVDNNQFV